MDYEKRIQPNGINLKITIKDVAISRPGEQEMKLGEISIEQSVCMDQSSIKEYLEAVKDFHEKMFNYMENKK